MPHSVSVSCQFIVRPELYHLFSLCFLLTLSNRAMDQLTVYFYFYVIYDSNGLVIKKPDDESLICDVMFPRLGTGITFAREGKKETVSNDLCLPFPS